MKNENKMLQLNFTIFNLLVHGINSIFLQFDKILQCIQIKQGLQQLLDSK